MNKDELMAYMPARSADLFRLAENATSFRLDGHMFEVTEKGIQARACDTGTLIGIAFPLTVEEVS